VPATGHKQPVGTLMRLLPIGKLGGADSQSPNQGQHGLRYHSFVQFLLDRSETTQTQKWGADLCHTMPNSECWGTCDTSRLFCPPLFQLLLAKIQLQYHFPAALILPFQTFAEHN